MRMQPELPAEIVGLLRRIAVRERRDLKRQAEWFVIRAVECEADARDLPSAGGD